MKDIFSVGVKKPLGYLAIRCIVDIHKLNINNVISDVRRMGNVPILFGAEQCQVCSGALFVYHPSSLEILLTKNKRCIKINRWPLDPHQFVKKVATTLVKGKTELFDVIADAFDDKTNPGRR